MIFIGIGAGAVDVNNLVAAGTVVDFDSYPVAFDDVAFNGVLVPRQAGNGFKNAH